MEPRLEPIEIAQRGELSPHLDEGHLDGVFGEVGVAQDPMRDENAAVADLTNQCAEGLFVALPRPIHDRSQHPLPLAVGPGGAPSPSMSVGVAGFVRNRRSDRLATDRDGD